MKSRVPGFGGYIKVIRFRGLIGRFEPSFAKIAFYAFILFSSTFAGFLEANGMRRIRFHDLRHSCASLMLSSGVPMKQIQEWLGHSDFSTTANIYAHLEYSSKLSSADAMLSGLGIKAS